MCIYFIIESGFFDVPWAVYHTKFLNTNWFRRGEKLDNFELKIIKHKKIV